MGHGALKKVRINVSKWESIERLSQWVDPDKRDLSTIEALF
jgi:hypothetical protein